MAVYIDSIKFKNPITLSDTDWLLANVGDDIIIELDISVKTYVLNSTQNQWILNNTDGYLATAGTIWITGGDFSKFEVGDVIRWSNYTMNLYVGSATIVEKLSDSEIRISNNIVGWVPNQAGTQDVISIERQIKSLNYQWNFIENNESVNYFSKVDGTEHLATITNLNAAGAGTNKPMTFIGAKSYQIGSITVDEVALNTSPIYESKFKIKHTTKITPIMLAEQWDDILNETAPDYFFNLNCLKSVFAIEARYDLTNPNDVQSINKDDILGNTGWFNENFNTKLTNYYISDLVFKDNANITIQAPQLLDNNPTSFSFKLKNTTSTPFSNGNTKVVLNFCKAPNDATEYQNNGRDMRHNFVWEQVTLTCGTVIVFLCRCVIIL